MVRIFILISFLCNAFISHSQVLLFSDVQKLGSGINSKGEESMPLLTPDGNRLFFIRSFYKGNQGGEYAGFDIWLSQKRNEQWNMPTPLKSLNTRDNDVIIGIYKDGRTIYSFRSSPSEKLEGIYFSRFENNTWRQPEYIPLPGIENEDFVGMFMNAEYDVLLLSMKGPDSRGNEDLYISLKDKSGAWSMPRNLGPTINTSGFEISPYLTADKKRLYFSSNGHEGIGDADIFYSDRLYNSWETWSVPVNLGDQINSKKFDAYFSIYGDSLAFFTSNKEQSLADIYTAKVKYDPGLLSAGQQYLSVEELELLVGKNVKRDFVFKKDQASLTASQRELLYYIANKISPEKNINVHLLVKEEENADLTNERLKEMYGELRKAGLDAYRIKEDQRKELINASNHGLIEIRFYK